jgi:hypothetical protein
VSPYGLPKEKGGDSPDNVKAMEKCVRATMVRDGVTKEAAIRICKTTLGFTKDDGGS